MKTIQNYKQQNIWKVFFVNMPINKREKKSFFFISVKNRIKTEWKCYYLFFKYIEINDTNKLN